MISDTMKLNSQSITIDQPMAPSHWHTEIQQTCFAKKCVLEAHKRTEYEGRSVNALRRPRTTSHKRHGTKAQATGPGWTKKRMDTRLTPAEIETTEDLGDLCDEVVEELRNADGSALELETHLPFTIATIRI